MVVGPAGGGPTEVTEGKLDKLEFYWRLYAEATTHGRHHETQRTAFSSFVFTLAPALYAVMRLDERLDRHDLPLALLMATVGVVGGFLSMKQYERFRYHIAQAGELRRMLDQELGTNTGAVRETARLKLRKKSYGWLQRWHLWWFPVVLHLLITALGVFLTFVAWTTR